MPAGMPKRHKWELQQLGMLSRRKLEEFISYHALKENVRKKKGKREKESKKERTKERKERKKKGRRKKREKKISENQKKRNKKR